MKVAKLQNLQSQGFKPLTMTQQYPSINPQIKESLDTTNRVLCNSMLQIVQSLVQTHYLMSQQSNLNQGHLKKIPSWHEEIRETVKSFRKRFSRLLGDVKYFMDFGTLGNSELKSICDQLGRTEILGCGSFLKSGLNQLSQVLTGEKLANYSQNQLSSSMNKNSLAQMRNSTLTSNIHLTPNNNEKRLSTGICSSRRSMANSNRSIRISNIEDPRGTITKVIIDGDTKHNTPNRIIRSRSGSVYNSGVNHNISNAGSAMATPIQNRNNGDGKLKSGRGSWRKASSRVNSTSRGDKKRSTLKKSSIEKNRENSKTRVYVTDGQKSSKSKRNILQVQKENVNNFEISSENKSVSKSQVFTDQSNKENSRIENSQIVKETPKNEKLNQSYSRRSSRNSIQRVQVLEEWVRPSNC